MNTNDVSKLDVYIQRPFITFEKHLDSCIFDCFSRVVRLRIQHAHVIGTHRDCVILTLCFFFRSYFGQLHTAYGKK